MEEAVVSEAAIIITTLLETCGDVFCGPSYLSGLMIFR